MQNEMKQVGGVWLPAHETHLVDWMKKMNQVVDGKLTYQLDKRTEALKWVKNFRTAVDVGGHCGLWSMDLSKRFAQLHAFEPVALHRACWEKNVGIAPGAMLYPCALGETDGMVSIHTANTSSGDSWVNGEGDIPLRRLDDFDLQDVDFIKLDCEGYELFALRGGEQTLLRCKPCIIVEQKGGRAQKFGLPETGAVTYLQSLGAKLRNERSGDYILSWD
jgi:FkbM family methyltransferase